MIKPRHKFVQNTCTVTKTKSFSYLQSTNSSITAIQNHFVARASHQDHVILFRSLVLIGLLKRLYYSASQQRKLICLLGLRRKLGGTPIYVNDEHGVGSRASSQK